MTTTADDYRTERDNALTLLAETATTLEHVSTEYRQAMLALEELRENPGRVYLLNIEVNEGGGNYDGWTSVHSTKIGALSFLEQFCTQNGIDINEARDTEVIVDGFTGNDVELSDGQTMSWGINRMEVKP